MRGKSLAWLLGVTILAVIAAVYVSRGTGPNANPLTGQLVMPDLAKRLADVGRMVLIHGDEKTTLARKGNSWSIEERNGYAANGAKVREALLGLADMRYVEPKTARANLYNRLDVEDAGKNSKSTLVTIADTKGALLGEVIVGKHRADQLGGGEGGVYVRKPGNAQSWLARGNFDLSGDTAAWLDKKLVDVPGVQVKEAVLTQPDGKAVTISRDKPGDKLQIAGMPAGKKLKYDSILDDTAGVLGALQLDDVRAAKDFAFPASGVTKARFTDFKGLTIAVELADKDGKSWVRFKASGEGEAAKRAADLNATLGPWVYALSNDKATTLRDKLDDLVEDAKSS